MKDTGTPPPLWNAILLLRIFLPPHITIVNSQQEPLFTDHILAICNAAEPLVLKAPKPFSNAERVPQERKIQLGHGTPTQARIQLATLVVAECIKEDQQATGGANLISFIARQVEEEEAFSIIKLEDLAKLVSNVQPSFKYLDSPEDDPVIVVDDSDEDDLQKDINWNFERTKAEAEDALLEAQPPVLNVGTAQ
ncbi:hypothetical protein Tco_0682089 [Tanacetum coccineum]|uniref:Uncharacterized protein n=1 Tax=Tanacetum coccineum TaxID=301880 RepID=A0ABQ4XRS9_9ASTR